MSEAGDVLEPVSRPVQVEADKVYQNWRINGMHTDYLFAKKSQVIEFELKNYTELN